MPDELVAKKFHVCVNKNKNKVVRGHSTSGRQKFLDGAAEQKNRDLPQTGSNSDVGIAET